MIAWPVYDIYGYKVPMGLMISPLIVYMIVYYGWRWWRRKK